VEVGQNLFFGSLLARIIRAWSLSKRKTLALPINTLSCRWNWVLEPRATQIHRR
jgi:hypothetical protein